MKRFLTIATWAVSIAAVCLAATSCKKDPKPTVPTNLEAAISFVSSTETTLTVSINVQDGATGYTYAIGQASDADSFADGTMEGIQTQEDASVAEVVFENLQPDTQYTIFARAFNAAGDTGSVAKLTRKTAAAPKEPDLSLSAVLDPDDITEEAFIIRLTYSEEDIDGIIYAVGTPDDQEAFENGTLQGIETVKPTSTLIISNLEKNTEYTVFIRTKSGAEMGPTVSVTGKTLEIILSLELIEKTTSSATIRVTLGGDATQFKYTTAIDGIDDMFISGTWPDISWVYSPETIDINIPGLVAGSTNTFYAQAYAANSARGELQKLTFTTNK